MLVYVNNIVVILKKLTKINWFKTEIIKVYKIKDLGEIKKIFGIKVIKNRKKHIIILN